MENITALDIFILYRSIHGRDSRFYDIDTNLDAMEDHDYTSAGFINAGGGISITVNGYLTLYRSVDFHFATDIVYFLLQSRQWLNGNGLGSKYYNAEDRFPADVVRYTISQDVLRLSIKDEHHISINYNRLNERIPLNKRGSMFFKDVVVSKTDWLNASAVALKEYQRMLDWIMESNGLDGDAEFLAQLSKYIDESLAV